MSSCDNPNVDQDALMSRRLKFDKSKLCVKCKENTGNIVIRHAVYCKSCFFPLISARFRKSLEPQINPKPDGPRRKALKAAGGLVIGLSGGMASTVLLDLVAKSYFHTPDANTSVNEGSESIGPKTKQRGGKDHPRNLTGNESGVWKGKPGVCYVETAGAFPGTKDQTEDVKKAAESYSSSPDGFEFEFISLRLENAFDEAWWKNWVGCDLSTAAQSIGMEMANENLPLSHLPSTSSSSTPSTPLSALHAYLSSLPTQTATHSAVQTLTRLLLLHTAASRGASHLLLGTSLTSLSINLISGIAQGAGFSVSEEAAEDWNYHVPSLSPLNDPQTEDATNSEKTSDRRGSVRIVRPLRDVGMKECAFWVWWSGLRVVGRERFMGGRQGIGSLTRDFIMGLEQDYPSTVSTIARTCAKVTPKERSDAVCVLCGRPAQPGVQEWKARISIRSYKDASFIRSGHPQPPHLSPLNDSQLELPNSTIPEALPPSTQSLTLTPHLCYACHTTLTSRSSRGTTASSSIPKTNGVDSNSGNVVPLPVWVRAGLAESNVGLNHQLGGGEVWREERMEVRDMKEHIKDFLLDE